MRPLSVFFLVLFLQKKNQKNLCRFAGDYYEVGKNHSEASKKFFASLFFKKVTKT